VKFPATVLAIVIILSVLTAAQIGGGDPGKNFSLLRPSGMLFSWPVIGSNVRVLVETRTGVSALHVQVPGRCLGN